MRMYLAAILLLFTTAAIAAYEPAPQARDSKSATTRPSASDFPTPAELIRKMKEAEKKKASLVKVAYINLAEPVAEKPADFSLFGEDPTVTLRSVLERLRMAREDHDIKAILITLGAQSEINFSQAQEIRDALASIVKSGKPCFVYADSYDTPGYTLASGADHVCMLEGGEIEMPGVGLEITFLKGLLDKLGVQADYVQIGEYKGADEEYTRTEASTELKGELTKLTDALYSQIVEGISTRRKLPQEQVRDLIDQTIIMGDRAKEAGLIDELTDEDGLRPLLAKALGGEVDLLEDFGRPPRPSVDLTSPFGFLSLLTRRAEPPADKPVVGIIYASGVITDGDAQGGLFQEEGVGSETVRRAFRVAERDPNVKAVVIRIDSPGGSALASEVMWQAARRCAAKKPVIVSVGSMAASGGYYLASAGDRIFADPSAIVGSIGVVGGKFVLAGLYDKLGLNSETFSRGKNAGLFSMNEPWTDHQRQMVTDWMKQTYNQFTRRVMKMRQGRIKDIDKVARGRIFLARQARDLGMVDQIGGVEDAIAYAAKKVGLSAGDYDVRMLPEPKTLADFLTGNTEDTKTPVGRPAMRLSDPMFDGMPPLLRQALGREARMLELLRHRPVALIAPFEVTIR